MILSRGRKYLFIHIPKTGGTSMALALEGHAMKDDLMLGDTPKALKRRHKLSREAARGRLWKHSTVADLEGVLAPGEAEDLFVFTLVRNPWDRAVSYYHWLREQKFAHPHVELAGRSSFAEFLRQPAILASFRRGQSESYVTTSGGIMCCDLFIRLEHLDEDIAPLERKLGFSLSLPRMNESKRLRDYREYYSDETAALIGEATARDIALFGYRF